MELQSRSKSRKAVDCTICGKVFYRNEVFQCHMRIHAGEKPYSCDICGKAFSHKGNKNQHVLLHSKTITLSCEFCNHTSFSKIYMNRHIKRAHPEHYVPSSRGQVPYERRNTRESNFRTFQLTALSDNNPVMPMVMAATEDKVYIPQGFLSQCSNSEAVPQNPGSGDSSSPSITCHICHDEFAARSEFQLHLMMHEIQAMKHSSAKNGVKVNFMQLVNGQNMNVITDPLVDGDTGEDRNKNQEDGQGNPSEETAMAVLAIKQEPL